VDGGGGCPPSAGDGANPGALAAFVERPQAAGSNRRLLELQRIPGEVDLDEIDLFAVKNLL
jgi:hypothetical protein